MCIKEGFYEEEQFNSVIEIHPKPTLIALLGNCNTKLAISWVVQEICARWLIQF